MRALKPHRIQTRLFLILLVSLFAGLLLSASVLYFQIEKYVHQRIYGEIQQYTRMTMPLIPPELILQGNQRELKRRVDKVQSTIGVRVTVIDTGGRVLADSQVPLDELIRVENHGSRPEVKEALQSRWGFHHRRSATIGRELYYVARKIEYRGKVVGVLRLAMSAEEGEQFMAQVVRALLLGALLVLLVSGALILILSKELGQKFAELVSKSRMLARGALREEIRIAGRDELGILAHSLNQMAARLSDLLQRLQKEKQELNSVLESIHDGIIALGPDQSVVLYNPVALSLLGIEKEDISGQKYYQVIRESHLSALIKRYFESPYVITDEVEMADGRIFQVIVSPFKHLPGEQIGAVLILRDITQVKKLERIRRDFVANVSHEFKTPLSSIRGYAETLLDWALENETVRRKYVEKILKQSAHLENLVSDLLQLARVERMTQIEMKPVDAHAIIIEVLSSYDSSLAEKQLRLEKQFSPDVKFINGDAEMFRTMMLNLIDNAVKYTPEGGRIEVSTRREGEWAVISVRDTGVGIPEKYLKRIFERFYRVDKARSRSVEGTGLGLSIVKHMAELQNAQVGVESEENVGSHFWMKFPIVSVDEQRA